MQSPSQNGRTREKIGAQYWKYDGSEDIKLDHQVRNLPLNRVWVIGKYWITEEVE